MNLEQVGHCMVTTEIINIFAQIAKADGQIKKVEDLNVEAILECLAAGNAPDAISRYHDRKNSVDLANAAGPIKKLAEIDLARKLEIVRALWQIAICDGELHVEEERLIYQFIDTIKMTRRQSIVAQLSA